MAAPLKPWERAGVNSQQNPTIPPVNNMSGLPPCCQPGAGGAASPTVGPPPPVPTRPTQSALGARPLMSSGYGMGGMGSYGGYSPMSSYGGMYNSPYSSYGGYGYGGYGYNRFGNNQDSYSNFARQAEENSRPAFQAIENVVSAVSSVGMMMDSTFQAVYNSFRAVIGVADNMSRLRSQLISVVSALAFIRTLKYMYRRFLEILRLRPPGYAAEAWNAAMSEAAASMAPGDATPKSSAWPIFMFFGIILGGPWLIWKLIRSFSSGEEGGEGWAGGQEDHFVARAEYTFQGNNNEISFTAGQMVNIAPKELQPRVKGWLLGCADGKTEGLLPANYVKVLGKRRGKKYETATREGQVQTPAPITPSASALSLNTPMPSIGETTADNDLDNMFREAETLPVNMDVESSSANMAASDILESCDSGTQESSDSCSSQTTAKECCSAKKT